MKSGLTNHLKPLFHSILPYPLVVEFHDKTNTCPPTPLIEKVADNISKSLSPRALHKSLTTIDCLFIIQYVPEDTIKPRWFLVQVNHPETKILKMGSLRIGDYHVTFLSRHPADKHLCDDTVCW